MKVLIISGFLGAGKTTFIKEMVKRCSKQFVILENEYGQNSLDSNELKSSSNGDLQLFEFAEGCVCCTKKDVFSNTILTISACLDPEYLIVEPTGIGKLSNIMLAIDKVSYEKIEILPAIALVSPEGFEENMNLYKDIYIDQIKNASKVILSKIEHTNIDIINDVTKKIKEINPNIDVITEHYSLKDDDFYDSLLLIDGKKKEIFVDDNETVLMDQFSYKNVKLNNLGELIVLLEDTIHHSLGLIARAKGVVKIEGSYVRFDVADGLYEITEDNASVNSECVFIGRYINHKSIEKQLHIESEMNSLNKLSKTIKELKLDAF